MPRRCRVVGVGRKGLFLWVVGGEIVEFGGGECRGGVVDSPF